MHSQSTISAAVSALSIPARLGRRSLVAGALLALTLAPFAAGPAYALPKEPKDGMCAKRGTEPGDEDWIFYSRGDIMSAGGHTFMCLGNDRWMLFA